MSREPHCITLGRECDFPEGSQHAVPSQGNAWLLRNKSKNSPPGSRWAGAVGSDTGKQHRGGTELHVVPCLQPGLSQIAKAWLQGGGPGMWQWLKEVPREAGATLASGGGESPGICSWGSAWPGCSVLGVGRQPKALVLGMFASQAGGTPGTKTQKL